MKTRAILGIGLSVAISWSAWAEEPIDPATLGSVDAIIATCHQVNPGGAVAYEALRKAVIGKQPESALAAIAQTPEYQQAFEVFRQKAEEEPGDSALKSCARLAAPPAPVAHHGDTRKAMGGKTVTGKKTSGKSKTSNTKSE